MTIMVKYVRTQKHDSRSPLHTAFRVLDDPNLLIVCEQT